ncbi:unnamed protein product [Symbiodinium sp. KB8]|nr:unnamed protein product [Symbiodinium sp. KB8]
MEVPARPKGSWAPATPPKAAAVAKAPVVVPRPKAPGVVVQPRPRRAAQFDAKEDPLEKLTEQMPQTFAGQLLKEVNEKTGEGGPGEERGPHGRGARPHRPAQIRRETGRSFDRLAEKLSEKVEALATCQAELNLCQHNLDAATAEQKRLATRNEELEKANADLSSQYQGMLQAMGPLSQSSADASQWKSAWYASEDTRRSLQTQLEEQSTKHAALMESMAREKDNRITELTQELLQLREQMEARSEPKKAAVKAKAAAAPERRRAKAAAVPGPGLTDDDIQEALQKDIPLKGLADLATRKAGKEKPSSARANPSAAGSKDKRPAVTAVGGGKKAKTDQARKDDH